MPVWSRMHRNAGRAVLAAAVAAPIVLLGAQSALAAWVQQTPPKPPGVLSASLGSVSCTAPAACMAIGHSQTTTGFKSFTETWDGTNWAIRKPADAVGIELNAVSCTSAAACTAVGEQPTSIGGYLRVAERWDGTSWAAQSVPLDGGHGLAGVSCTSATRCVAVGNGSLPFSASWNGTSWTEHSAPLPAGVQSAAMNAVSCWTGKACEAVGEAGAPVAWSWSGRQWTAQTVPLPSGAQQGQLDSVSCGTPDFCLAVGSYQTSSGPTALADVWNGTNWTVQATAPLSTAVEESALLAVSCVRAVMCTAVGDQTRYGHGFLLSERWTGSRFVLQRSLVIPPKTQFTTLDGVSCPSQSDCTATGWSLTAYTGKARLLAEQDQG